MSELFKWMFSSQGFMPHGHCYLWQPGTMWLNVGSDAMIAAAYFVIPFSIYDFVRRRTADIPFRGIFLMFAAFILLCGSTHVMEIWTVWNPDYRFGGALKLLTGIVSIATTLALFRIMPHASQLRSPRQLQQEVVARTAELTEVNAKLQLTIQELEQQREELQTMLDLLPVGIAIAHDALGNQMTASTRLAELLGVSTAQNLSLSAEDGPRGAFRCLRNGNVIPPEELPMQLAARTGQEQRDVNLDVEFADGRTITLMVSAAPLFHPDGHVRGAIGTHVDVTGLKRIQRELEEADRQKNEFLAMLAHELRNPLAPVRNAAELLVRASHMDSRTQSAVAMIQRQVSHLTRLVDDLLDVARITRGQIELKLSPIELAPVVAMALEAVEPFMKERQHRVSVTYPTEPLYVNGDATRLVQCMVNILNNAAKYTDPGGEVQVELSVDTAMALITIRDNGMGVVSEFLPRMFELFSQSRRALDRAQGGLGVGLSLVRKIVEMHQGRVECTSAGIGQGCTCKMWLPLTRRRITAAPEPRTLKVTARRVMIVDDNHDAADSLAMMLALDGHQMHVAYSAESALADAATFRPEVILLDIGLPMMDGYEVARRLRAMPGFNQVRIVALTGYGHLDDRRIRTAEFDAHLVKPVDFETLAEAIMGSHSDS